MPRAIWNGVIVAESDTFETVEGNIYFPPLSLKMEHFKPSRETSFCPWKGTASYFDVEARGKVASGGAWTYPETKPEAAHIKGYVAFWRGVEVKP